MIGILTNHLWQSTWFAVAVILLAVTGRGNRAQIRYCLWLSASLKFLVPFGLIATAAASLEGPHRTAGTAAMPNISNRVEQIAEQIVEPFAIDGIFAPRKPGPPGWLLAVTGGVWFCGFCGIAFVRLREWRQIRSALRASLPVAMPAFQTAGDLAVRVSSLRLEPGVVGWFRPVLLLPAGITARLTPSQLNAVLQHELCHVRRRDNLFALVHTIVETLFWFHPLVWWIGARLVEERERACDEEVLQSLVEPRIYAEGILSVCRHYVESSGPCVSGVTGGDLKMRIDRIMRRDAIESLTFARKTLLAAAGTAAVCVPVAMSYWVAPAKAQSTGVPAVSYVASVKPNNAADARTLSEYSPSGFLNATAITLQALLRTAYRVQGFQIAGAPGWLATKRFDIAARTEGNPPPMQQALLQALLKDRFGLAAHMETRESEVFSLVQAKSDGKLGPKVVKSDFDCDTYRATPRSPADLVRNGLKCAYRSNSGDFTGYAIQMSELAQVLSFFVGRPVTDKTGLAGRFDMTLQWMPDTAATAGAGDTVGPSLTTAIQEQLGLKLVAGKGPVSMLVVDRVEEPSGN